MWIQYDTFYTYTGIKLETRWDGMGWERTGTGQDGTGQDRTGQDRTGQDRTGQDMQLDKYNYADCRFFTILNQTFYIYCYYLITLNHLKYLWKNCDFFKDEELNRILGEKQKLIAEILQV